MTFIKRTLFFLLLPLLFGQQLYAQQGEALSLYSTETGISADRPLPAHRESQTYIRLNDLLSDRENLSKGGRLELPIGDAVFRFIITRISKYTDNTYSVLGRDERGATNYLSFTIGGGRITGTVHLHEKDEIHQLNYDSRVRSNYIASLAYSELDRLSCPSVRISEEDNTLLPEPRPPAADPETGGDQHVNIDLLIMYTSDAEQWMEGYSSTGSYIAEIANRSQLALDNSNVNINLNVVHSARTDYNEDPQDSEQTLHRLTDKDDGYMDEAHSLRNTHSADLVALLADVSDVGGIAWILNTTSGAPAYGFSVNRVQQLYFTQTFAHEIGHNLGNHHSRNQSSSPAPSSGGLKEYSTGWRWTGDDGVGYVSVMTYEEGDTETPHFSNPDVTYQGTATGSYSGQYAPADNARSMNEIRNVVADYRVDDSEPGSPPGTPSLNSPADGAAGLSRTPTLDWNASSGADSYRVQLATSSNFNTLVANRSQSTTSHAVSDPLNHSTTYHWRVRASNSDGNSSWSEVRSFTTTINTPSIPEPDTPPDGEAGTEIRPQLDWHPSQRADSYTVQLAATSDFGNPVINETLSGTAHPVAADLDYLTTYYWRVRASNKAGDSEWSAVRNFTTTIRTPEPTSPSDGQTALSRRPQFNWTVIQHADNYLLQVSRDADFSALVFEDLESSNGYKPAEPLEYLITYYWRIKARDAETGIESGWSPMRSFETVIEPPEKVRSGLPGGGAYQVPVTPTLSWHPSSRAANYSVQISTGEEFSEVALSSTTEDTSLTVSEELEYATRYYWRVQAQNEGGTGDWSEPVSFTTIVDETEITINYPNPFRNTTTIRYQLARQSEIRLEVFNTIGQRVKTLVDEQQEPKVYNYTFDASHLASGVYIVRLVTGDTMDILMMTRVK